MASVLPTSRWVPALALDELPPGALRVWKNEGRQILLVRGGEEVHALDNRCPHEGYPLHTGTLQESALTCCWHNWKFDIRDGRCLLGEEGVRRFPTRIADGRVEVDLAEPDPQTLWPGLLASFHEGLYEHQVARIARDGVRLLEAGFDPWRLLAEVARHDARHAEYGSTHALAAAAEAGRLLERHDGPRAMIPIAVAADMCGEANRRLAPRPRPEPVVGCELHALRAAVESEDAARAEGLLRGAFRDGIPRARIEGWLAELLGDHFLDFGHPLIYLVKARDLLDRAGEETAEEIYGALLYSIVLGTREDTLPYMAAYFAELDPERLQLWLERPSGGGDGADLDAVRQTALDGARPDAIEALRAALDAGARPGAIARELLAAAAHRLYRFDLGHDGDPEVAEGWLWATHRLTFAMAVVQAVERHPGTGALRLLFQSLAFTNSGRPMDAPPERRLSAVARAMPVSDVLAAIAGKDAGRAVAGAAAALEGPGRLAELRLALEDLALRDPAVRPIVVVHVLKTLLAAFDARDALAEHPDRDRPVLAAIRFLASPLRERRVHEAVERSIAWVADGRMPRKLTQ